MDFAFRAPHLIDGIIDSRGGTLTVVTIDTAGGLAAIPTFAPRIPSSSATASSQRDRRWLSAGSMPTVALPPVSGATAVRWRSPSRTSVSA